MAIGSATLWLGVGLGLWAFIVGSFIVLGWFRGRARERAREARPEYELGDSIKAWRLACDQSLEWSQSRRNGTKIKREVH